MTGSAPGFFRNCQDEIEQISHWPDGHGLLTDATRGLVLPVGQSLSGVALELAASRAEAERLSLYQDRDRIARDLHDLVIQRLYATGMSLEGTMPMITRPEQVDVTVDVDPDGILTVLVADDGAGIPAEIKRSGRRNLAPRAQDLGGELRLGPADPEAAPPGTRLEWRVPRG